MNPLCMRPIHVSAIAAWISLAPANAAAFSGNHEIQIPLVRMLAAFVICALAALVLALFVKAVWLKNGVRAPRLRLFSSLQSPPKGLNVLETRALSPHASLSRVTYDDLEFLILISAQSASVLHQKPATIAIDAERQP